MQFSHMIGNRFIIIGGNPCGFSLRAVAQCVVNPTAHIAVTPHVGLLASGQRDAIRGIQIGVDEKGEGRGELVACAVHHHCEWAVPIDQGTLDVVSENDGGSQGLQVVLNVDGLDNPVLGQWVYP